MEKRRITFSWGEFRSIASLAEIASKEDVTPVLTGVNITITEDTIRAVSTDRYRIGRIILPRDIMVRNDDIGTSGDSFTISAAQLKKAAAAVKASKPLVKTGITLRYEFEAEKQTETGYILEGNARVFYVGGEVVVPFVPNYSNSYPAVEKLMDAEVLEVTGDYTGSIAPQFVLSSSLLATIEKLIHPANEDRIAKPGTKWRFYTPRLIASKKPAPVYAEAIQEWKNLEGRMDFLIQPNLIVN
jgi:hypothetical protein